MSKVASPSGGHVLIWRMEDRNQTEHFKVLMEVDHELLRSIKQNSGLKYDVISNLMCSRHADTFGRTGKITYTLPCGEVRTENTDIDIVRSSIEIMGVGPDGLVQSANKITKLEM